MNRAEIVMAAYSWDRTPYHHQAGVKGAGVDCAYLIGKVAEEIGAIDKFYVEPYSIEWHWHSKEERMCNIVESFGAKQIPKEERKPGDILAFKYGRVCSHLGILVTPDYFIHAHIKAERVIVNSLSGEFLDRLERVYQFPNLEE
jgi:NlpC/P60 family putative phage cell wall peptidase